MTFLDAFFYGAVQGLTEYLPVSSTAHLILLPRFMNWNDPGLAFDVFLHLGTLLSTAVYFRKEWTDLVVLSLKHRKPLPELVFIVFATLPALAAGALLNDFAENVLRGNPVIITSLVLGGILLFAIDRKKGREGGVVANITIKQALVVGLTQCLAIVPGFSRSGATIMGGRII